METRNMSIGQEIELNKLKEEVRLLKSEPFVKKFADTMLEQIGIILATTPFNSWPNVARVAFSKVSSNTPAAASLYLERLPVNEKIE